MNKYYYEFERVNAYCYPDSYVLINKFDIHEADTLNALERELTSTRIQQILDEPIRGKLDLKHLLAIHKAIFSDIYFWAGELRTVNIAKGNQFVNYQYLEQYGNDVFSKLKGEKYLTKTAPADIPGCLAYYLGEINVLHPFREGNGRTQRIFIEYLAQVAGYSVSFADVSSDEMIEASARAFALNYGMMNAIFERITAPITPEEQRDFKVKLGISRPPKQN